jgi:hypothetical protein
MKGEEQEGNERGDNNFLVPQYFSRTQKVIRKINISCKLTSLFFLAAMKWNYSPRKSRSL